MTERERIIASFSAAEIEIYKRLGGVASPRVEAEWARKLMDVAIVHGPRKLKRSERTERRLDRKMKPAPVRVVAAKKRHRVAA